MSSLTLCAAARMRSGVTSLKSTSSSSGRLVLSRRGLTQVIVLHRALRVAERLQRRAHGAACRGQLPGLPLALRGTASSWEQDLRVARGSIVLRTPRRTRRSGAPSSRCVQARCVVAKRELLAHVHEELRVAGPAEEEVCRGSSPGRSSVGGAARSPWRACPASRPCPPGHEALVSGRGRRGAPVRSAPPATPRGRAANASSSASSTRRRSALPQ